MRFLAKNTIIFFLFILFSQFIFTAIPTNAAQMNFIPQISIGSFTAGTPVAIDPNSIGNYIKSIYNYSIGIVGILCVIVMMLGGVIWITSAGSSERMGTAKSMIGSAVLGLVLTLSSYMILKTVNTNLTVFQPIKPETVDTSPYNKDNESCQWATTIGGDCSKVLGGKWQSTDSSNCDNSKLTDASNQQCCCIPREKINDKTCKFQVQSKTCADFGPNWQDGIDSKDCGTNNTGDNFAHCCCAYSY